MNIELKISIITWVLVAGIHFTCIKFQGIKNNATWKFSDYLMVIGISLLFPLYLAALMVTGNKR